MTFFDAYFKIKPEQYKNNKIILLHDSGDILPLSDNINAFCIYSCAEFSVVKLRLSQENLESFIENVPEGVSPFSYEGAANMGLSDSYIGHTWEEVEAAFPGLTTPIETLDDEGKVVLATKMCDTIIS